MAKKLYGTDPDQVPTNADLGTMAYQDRGYLDVGEVHSDNQTIVSTKSTNALSVTTNASSNVALSIGGSSTINGVTSSAQSFYIMNVARDSGSGKSTYFNGHVGFPSGYGIDFSASAGSGASSSVLDDYEEGTWTPTFSYGTSVTYGSQLGKYIKIGRMVYIEFYVVVTAHNNTDTSFIHLASLPFTPDANDTLITTLNTPECTLLKLSDADSRPSSGGRIVNSADINFCGQGSTYMKYDDCNGSGDFFGAATYYANA